MSGLVACFDRDGAIDRETILAMLERIDHRGPDGDGLWVDDRIGIGHQHWCTTPEGIFDQQPLCRDGVVVAFDGRLDTRPTLYRALSDIVRTPLSETPDSQLVSAAYKKWGQSCVDHLVGAFAFVIWDADKESVFCARDHFGVKPLYYHLSEGTFAVASEIRALLEVPSVRGQLDRQKVGDFLTGTFDRSSTFFRSVRRLPPAHGLAVGSERARRWQYWRLDPTRTITLASDGAYERRFRALFEQAVQCRLRGRGAVGAQLSGGMDSSSVTVMARELLPSSQPLYTFSNVYDESPSSDEREFIETVVDRPGIVSDYILLDDRGVLSDCEEVLATVDEPPHNTMNFAERQNMKCARDAGVKTILTGGMGDSAVGYGLGLLPELVRTGRWRLLYSEVSAMASIFEMSKRELFYTKVLKRLVPEPVAYRVGQLRGNAVCEQVANPTLDPAFVKQIGLRERYRNLCPNCPVRTISGRRWQHQSLLFGGTTAMLESQDQLGAHFGVEPRHPFTDKRLVEFSLAIPSTQQLKNGWMRSILRRSIGDLLPDPIQWRPWKTSVSTAFWNALKLEDDRLQTLCEQPGAIRPFIDIDELQAAYVRFTAEPTSQDARSLWRALSLQTWLLDDTVPTSGI